MRPVFLVLLLCGLLNPELIQILKNRLLHKKLMSGTSVTPTRHSQDLTQDLTLDKPQRRQFLQRLLLELVVA